MRAVTAGLLLCIVLSPLLLAGCVATPSLRVSYPRFEALTQSEGEWDAARHGRLEEAYQRSFAPHFARGDLTELETRDVERLFDAADLVSFYTTDAHVDNLRRALEELSRRGAASARHYQDTYAAYIHWRQFDRADALYREHPAPGMEALPEIIDPIGGESTQPTELAVVPDRRALERRVIARDERTRIIVVSHPNCHFSRNASEAIDADAELSGLFRAHAKWLAPADGNIEFDALQAWNRKHPQSPVSLAYRASEWPQIQLTSTPVFHFFSPDHKLVETISGWPKEGQRDELLMAARRAGLLP